MRMMVTGGAGFVGSHLVDRFLAEGHEVEVVDDLSSGSIARLVDARKSGSFTFHHMDVRSPGLVDLIGSSSPDVLWHLAGRHSGNGSFADPVGDAEVAVLGVLNVLEAARLHRSTKVGVLVRGLYRREEPTAGRTLVGQRISQPVHVATEAVVDYVRVYCDVYGVDGRVLACSSIYGPHQRAEGGGVVASFVAAATAGNPPTVEGSGSQVRDLVHVDDVVDAIARASDLPTGSIVPIGSGKSVAIEDLARLVMQRCGVGGEPLSVPGRRSERPGIAFPVEDAANRMGWRSFTSLTDGIDDLIQRR